MELVQWIVPLDDGSVAVGWAPVWADRMHALGRLSRPVRRRGAPLVSRWLPCPLAAGALEEPASGHERADAPIRAALRAGALSVILGIAADTDESRSILPPDADDLRFAGLYSELVRVTADLAEAAGMPPAGVVPSPERGGMELGVGTLGAMTARQLADALLLFRAAMEMCVQARGLKLTLARVRLGDTTLDIDGKIAGALTMLATKESR